MLPDLCGIFRDIHIFIARLVTYILRQLLGRRRLNELKKAGYNTELPAPLDNIPQSTSTERERIEESVCSYSLCSFNKT